MNSPKEEQEICVTCGFCCDGTLFNNAVLQAGEKGNLPVKMEEGYIKTEKEEFFQLPCSYFIGKCTIYDQKKAHICSAFRCKLLKDFAMKEVTHADALEIVQNSIGLREEVMALSQAVFENQEILPFRQILEKIGYMEEVHQSEAVNSRDFKLLKIKATILEALLIKYFKSKQDFDRMIENPEDGKTL